MNSDEVLSAINEVAAESSKTGKQAMLAEYGKDEMFFNAVRYALDPFRTYGIGEKSLPKQLIEGGTGEFTPDTWITLLRLSNRDLTGNAAQTQLEKELSAMTPISQELLRRILLKDLRAGFSESTANKAIPNWVPTFDCMLAHPFSDHKHKLSYPLWVEPKLDGVRVLTFVDVANESVRFFSRSGKEFTTFEHLKLPILSMVNNHRCDIREAEGDDADAHLFNLVLDGEVVSGSFNKTVGDVRRKNEQAVDAKLCVFDLLPLSTFFKDDKKGCADAGTYLNRRAKLRNLFACKETGAPLVMLPSWEVHNEDEVHEKYEECRARGLEGLIVKDPNGLYHRRRNHAWSKIKAEESVDIRITGIVEGTGKYAGKVGALVVDFNGTPVNVGTGLDDAQREDFWADRNLIGRLVEVGYHEITPDGSLRHPRFMRFRDDKDVRSE